MDDRQRATHRVVLGGVARELPLFEVAPGLRIAVLNLLGDVELVEACADALAPRVPREAEVIVTAEAKSIPLAHALALRARLPYVVLRKSWKPYMGNALRVETRSITTGAPQTLHLDEKDRALLAGRAVALLDDVVSTGSTLDGMRRLVDEAKGRVVAELAVLTEGDDEARWAGVARLGHLPLFRERAT